MTPTYMTLTLYCALAAAGHSPEPCEDRPTFVVCECSCHDRGESIP